jgi:hypothetical protein
VVREIAVTCQIDVEQCDGEVAKFYTAKIVKARRPHRCIECHQEIVPGEQYELVKGMWDGRIDTISTCSICLEVRKAFFCTWMHGCMWEDFGSWAEEDDFELSALNGLSRQAIDMISEHL